MKKTLAFKNGSTAFCGSFIQYLQQKNFTPRTIASSLRVINDFMTHHDDPLNITKKHILQYLQRLREQDKKNATINIYLRQLRYYFDHLIASGQITTNPTQFIKIRGIKRQQLYKTFGTEQLTQFLDDYYNVYIQNHDLKPNRNTTPAALLSRYRNHCILSLLIHQGIQTSELGLITVDHIDLTKATLTIPQSHRTNTRTLTLQATQIGILMHYIQQLRPQIITQYEQETDRLFLPSVGQVTKKQTQNYSNLLVHLKAQLQSISADFTQYRQIRASVITAWIQTRGLRQAQYMAGHRYTSSTEKYLPNDIAQLSEELQKYHPF